MKYFYSLLLLLSLILVKSQTVSGTILSEGDQLPIPFAKIIVEKQNFGVLADKNGVFTMDLNSVSKDGKIKIEVPGYDIFSQSVAQFIQNSSNKIYLKEKVRAIEEIKIIANQCVYKKNWGNSTKNKNIMLGHVPSKNDTDRSKEIAVKFKNKRRAKIEKIHLNVAKFDTESPVFVRFNVYDSKMNSILTDDIFDEIIKKNLVDATYTLDVAKYNIWANGEFYVSIQILNAFEGSIYFSGSLMGQKAIYRNYNEDWKDVPVVSIALNIDAKVQKGKKGEIDDDDLELTSNDDLSQYIPDLSQYNEAAKKSIYGKNDAKGHLLNLSDAKIYYEIYGEGEPLFLLHGNSGSIEAFYQQIPELAKHYKVIAVDTRAQGKSTDLSNKDFNYQIFADDMLKLADELKLEKINIVGWSDGGNTGLEFALKYPNRLNKLVTIGANIFPEGVIDPLFSGMNNELKNLTEENNPDKISQLRLLKIMLKHPNIAPSSLNKIKNPVLVIAGEHDVIKPTHTEMISKSIPNSKLLMVEKGTHFIPFQNPDLLNKAIVDFLK